ncbi:MAG: hypothetical protein M3Z09_02330 [Acidobacteriota bacterium]|nr:hypothetical protein [Acidobacteriota bacterium]
MTDVLALGELLTFHAGQDQVALSLGSDLAKRWAKAIATPAPSLAHKLGILSGAHVLLIGEAEGVELKEAIAQANPANNREVSLILACVNTHPELNRALDQYLTYAAARPPIWIVYPKGPGKQLSESGIREALRSNGFIDTKVARVSAKLTALCFRKRVP